MNTNHKKQEFGDLSRFKQNKLGTNVKRCMSLKANWRLTAMISSVLDCLGRCSGTSAFKCSYLHSVGLLLLPMLAVARSAFLYGGCFFNFTVWSLAPCLYEVKREELCSQLAGSVFKGIISFALQLCGDYLDLFWPD